MMEFTRRMAVVRIFAVVLLLVFSALGMPAGAQTFRGTILGTVTDSSGLAVGGATVMVRNVDTGLLRTVTTSEDGGYLPNHVVGLVFQKERGVSPAGTIEPINDPLEGLITPLHLRVVSLQFKWKIICHSLSDAPS